jgi:ribosomal protein S12 methylthiotransferase accessory factor
MPKVDLSAFKPTRLTMSEREISSREAFVRINNVIQTLGLRARVRYVDDGNLVATAEALQIIIIKDESEVYLAVALPRTGPGDRHISAIGSGCSLDIFIAIQRAVTEQFQSNALYDANDEIADRKILDVLCQSEKLEQLIDFAPVKNLKLNTLAPPKNLLALSVPEQLALLRKNLSGMNKVLFFRTVMEYPGTNVVTQTYIPGLDRFNIIRNGQPVAPQHILLGTRSSPTS